VVATSEGTGAAMAGRIGAVEVVSWQIIEEPAMIEMIVEQAREVSSEITEVVTIDSNLVDIRAVVVLGIKIEHRIRKGGVLGSLMR